MKITDLIEDFSESSSTLSIVKSLTTEYVNFVKKSNDYNYVTYIKEKYHKFIINFNVSNNQSYTDIDDMIIQINIPSNIVNDNINVLEYFVSKTLMHELTHVNQYTKISKNINKWPDSNKDYHLRSHELDARYNDGYVDVSYDKNISWDNFLKTIMSSLTRNNKYQLDKAIIKKYTSKAYKDFKELKEI
jgi:hypothetical protein